MVSGVDKLASIHLAVQPRLVAAALFGACISETGDLWLETAGPGAVTKSLSESAGGCTAVSLGSMLAGCVAVKVLAPGWSIAWILLGMGPAALARSKCSVTHFKEITGTTDFLRLAKASRRLYDLLCASHSAGQQQTGHKRGAPTIKPAALAALFSLLAGDGNKSFNAAQVAARLQRWDDSHSFCGKTNRRGHRVCLSAADVQLIAQISLRITQHYTGSPDVTLTQFRFALHRIFTSTAHWRFQREIPSVEFGFG